MVLSGGVALDIADSVDKRSKSRYRISSRVFADRRVVPIADTCISAHVRGGRAPGGGGAAGNTIYCACLIPTTI
ncbi:unnamed protein product [Euphydryas editha]|uniref:Carbohydrate kinase PfkB domain-containing protein n=1 Tax=Euphydryas editha TaxID=104508 RepID=A0AAU9U7X1_EUPED|nr:unnamed protein product [Euphydryas editha]